MSKGPEVFLPVGSTGRSKGGALGQRLAGFYVMWHCYGGLHGMLASGQWSRSSVYANLRDFVTVYRCTPDEIFAEVGQAVRHTVFDPESADR